MSEVVKTGLLAGQELWELPEPELVRRCAAFKAAVCLRDPRDEGERAMLNLGHTFAHALEAASKYELPHGEAVALGLTAALRLSGLPDDAARVDELLAPEPARVDLDAAWAALKRDKKSRGGVACSWFCSTRPASRAQAWSFRRRMCGARSPISSRRTSVRVEVLNGVNLDVLGRRDPEIYGGLSLNELESRIYEWGKELGLGVRCRQTNDEGQYIEWLHEILEIADAVVVNPAAWTHYSYAIRDAVELLDVPVVEVHLSNVDEREDWRRVSVISDLAAKRVVGKGPDGYREALEFLAEARP